MYRDTPAYESFKKDVFEVMSGQGIAHERGHVERVAFYAKEDIKRDGKSSHEQMKADAAGIAHDVIRPPNDNPHELHSAEKFIELIEPYQSALNLSNTDIIQMYDAIAFHSDMPNVWGINPIQDAVFFADKVFEASGAYVLFRRALFMAENKDAKGAGAVEKTLIRTKQKTAKFKPEVFPIRVRKIAQSQYNWQIEFLHGLENKEQWAVNIAEVMHEHGRNKEMPLEDSIRNYEPVSEIDARFKKEAVDYLDGKLVRLFF